MTTISTVKTIWDGLDWSYIVNIITSVIPALICITLHELSHGYVAFLLGDNTAKEKGRLTLNPIKHIDVMGLVMMVAFKVGWAKPVPVDMRNFKNPKQGMAITAFAGPLSNVIIAIVFMFVYGLLYIPLTLSSWNGCSVILEMIQITAYISIGFAIFNLIPISPLDGSKILFSFLSDKQYLKLMYYEKYGMIILFALVATGIFGKPLSNAINYCFEQLFIFTQFGYDIVLRLYT